MSAECEDTSPLFPRGYSVPHRPHFRKLANPTAVEVGVVAVAAVVVFVASVAAAVAAVAEKMLLNCKERRRAYCSGLRDC